MIIKKIKLLLLAIILGGCMDSKLWFGMKTADVKLGTGDKGCRNVEKYLYERYGEEFVCDYAGYTTSHGTGIPEYYGEEYTIYPKKYENQTYWDNTFVVLGRMYDDGPYTYRDGYFGVYGREKYRQYVEDILKPLFDGKEYYVGVRPFRDVFANEITKDTKISELFDKTLYSEDKPYMIHTIWVMDSDYNSIESVDEINLEIARVLKKHKLLGKVNVYTIFDDKKNTFLEHKNYYLEKILTGEEYKKHYDEKSEYHRSYMNDLLMETQNWDLMLSRTASYRVKVDNNSDNKNEIKIYVSNVEVE
ncbi:MAG: hypothetical protein MR601_07640 [Erysipelotrichaceae bacterium]|nr:hypothetical protein [Erysipelotrichaceae bacterium]